MKPPCVAIIAPERDQQLAPVCAAFTKRGVSFWCFDLAAFPARAVLTACLPDQGKQLWKSTLTWKAQQLMLEDVTAIWNRRRGRLQYTPAPQVIDYAQQFSSDEARHGMDGIWKSSEGCLWVNHPDANRAADSKPYQLALAKQCHLSVPKSLLTNDPKAVRAFFEECEGQVIYKTLNRNVLRPPEGFRYLYTSQVHAEDIRDLSGVSATVHFFQQLIPKCLELRITIVGSSIFAAEIYSQHAEKSRLDFRRSYEDLRYGIHALPPPLQKRLLVLMHKLHLEYAAIDMILRPDGEYVFLEANCVGQYGWIEQETSLPISETLAALLVHEAPQVADALREREELG